MSHLRAIRLARARQDLLVADPETTTVTSVAGRWGFVSASTFAARYRATFGELPSQTLHR